MEDKIAKLPKWVQEYIRKIERERETAIRQLNEYCDNQTKSPFFCEEMVSIGERAGPEMKRKYIQAYKMSVVYRGVRLNIMLRNEDGIELSWEDDRRCLKDIAFIPNSYQQAKLVAKKDMRE